MGDPVIRAGLFVLIGSAVLAAILHVNVWIVLVPVGLLMIATYATGAMKLRCPNCGKRIKIGYKACHHCGWTSST